MYLDRYISLWMHLRYMYLIMYLQCILNAIQISQGAQLPRKTEHELTVDAA